tara:strand:+ start:2175 stop:3479 length:1305 start_codon:yes stop_codon:yes gene_type:complete
MGIFGKIFKGIGKVFKGIGKFLKKKWKKFGKFMNKLGIVGQIGMMLVTSGMMNAAMAGMSFIGKGAMLGLKTAAQTSKIASAVLRGVNTVVNAANTVKGGLTAVSNSITGSIGAVLKPTLQAMGKGLQKIPGADRLLTTKMKQSIAAGPKNLGEFGDAVLGGFEKTGSQFVTDAKAVGTSAKATAMAPFTKPDIKTIGTKGTESFQAFDVSQPGQEKAFVEQQSLLASKEPRKEFFDRVTVGEQDSRIQEQYLSMEEPLKKAGAQDFGLTGTAGVRDPLSIKQGAGDVFLQPQVDDFTLGEVGAGTKQALFAPNPANIAVSPADQFVAREGILPKMGKSFIPDTKDFGQAVTQTVVAKAFDPGLPDRVPTVGEGFYYRSQGMDQALEAGQVAGLYTGTTQFDAGTDLFDFGNPMYAADFIMGTQSQGRSNYTMV